MCELKCGVQQKIKCFGRLFSLPTLPFFIPFETSAYFEATVFRNVLQKNITIQFIYAITTHICTYKLFTRRL